jgi:hypothetical protein
MKQKTESFAEVKWTVEDVKTLRPYWTDEQCVDFFQQNERHIKDRLVELGWDVIGCLLPPHDKNFCAECGEPMKVVMKDTDGTNLEETTECSDPECSSHS